MIAVDARFPHHAGLAAAVAARLPPGELAHDRFHIARVYRWALRLAPEAGADPDLAGAAALVHDLVFVAKDSPERASGGERSAAAAPVLLAAAGYGADAIAAIAAAVATSSWSRGLAPAGALGAVLQDADRLDALGALGLMRNLACAQHMARPEREAGFYHPDDPLHRSARPLDDRAWAADHCFAKLLRLAAGMHTATARAEAARRHAFIEGWLRELETELG